MKTRGRIGRKTATRTGVVVVLALVMAACTPPPPADGTPVIYSFSANSPSGPAPLTTAFTWNIADIDDPTLTCSLDLDDDGIFEVTESSCTKTSVRSATFDTPGTHPVRLRVTDGTSTVTSAPLMITVGAASADTFAIDVRFTGAPTPSQEAAFLTAADRWSEVIKTGLPDVDVDFPPGICLSGAPAFTGTIDDVMIDASIVPIDGPGGILGSAGQCYTRPGGLSAHGVMRFDSADVADLEADGAFEAVILHEMGHVLGIGGLQAWSSRVQQRFGPDPQFTGLTARGAWDAIVGGSGVSVPVEDMGGLGTFGVHWRESVFGDELMTGYLSGPSQPLSTVTVGSLADMGYGVDLAAADPFGTPAIQRSPGPAIQLHTELIHPIGEVG